MKISILGSGCPKCKTLHATVERVVNEEKINAEVEYSDDVSRIVELGILQSPVLVVDGVPVHPKSFNANDIKDILSNQGVENSACCEGGKSCGIGCKTKNTAPNLSSIDCSCGKDCK
jgi:small redox-active disulfide protein 2